ncbi:MAG: prephenate dehydratase [Deltaproteobacteria bacterium]|nr:prephenate dehydratase [Deltaproteobacteria bacterium]
MKKSPLEELRKEIRQKDKEIVTLLNERAKLSLEVGAVKIENGREVYDPSRESLIFQFLSQINPGPLSDKAVQDIFREIISSSRALQGPVTVAYFGPEASFTHLVALAHFGKMSQFFPQKNIAQVFEQVERERCAYGVVPIENSGEGAVKQTLDRLSSTPLSIRAEVFLRISHYLISSNDNLEKIKRVYSHPQAIAQCQGWLEKNLPQCSLSKVENTAQAAQKVLEDLEGAAIGSQEAAQLYGLKILADRIEDYPLNTTRFLVMGRGQSEATGRDKTSILFGTPHTPGALFHALEPFNNKELNLLKIESYPLPDRIWEYLFFVDFSGHWGDEKVRQCLKDLETVTTFIKVLGSYPWGEGLGRK